MDDPSQRIFLIAQGKGNEAHAVGALGLRGINWRSRHAEYWIYLGDRLARGKGLADEASRLLLRFAFGTFGIASSLSPGQCHQPARDQPLPAAWICRGRHTARRRVCGRPLRRPSPAFHAVARISTVPGVTLCLKKTQAHRKATLDSQLISGGCRSTAVTSDPRGSRTGDSQHCRGWQFFCCRPRFV